MSCAVFMLFILTMGCDSGFPETGENRWPCDGCLRRRTECDGGWPTDPGTGATFVAVERVVLVVFCCAVLTAVFVVALGEQRWARARRRTLSQALERSETRAAFNELMAAQTLFTAEVLRYEAALAAQTVPAGTVRIDLYAPGAQRAAEPIERMKDGPRRRLLTAKQRWEQVRPGAVIDAGPPRWIGFGEIRSWGLGCIGGERAFLRFEHATDPSIWCTVEVSRRRVGLGLGVEVQRIGALADHADPSVLLAMVRASFDHTDVAVRPGFDPVRFVRNVRERGPFQDLAEMLRARSATPAMWLGTDRYDLPATRKLLDAIDSDAAATVPDPSEPGLLQCSISGPAVMLGWWRGRGRPHLRLLARSPHGEWSRRYDASGQHVPEPASVDDEPARSTLSGVATNSQR